MQEREAGRARFRQGLLVQRREQGCPGGACGLAGDPYLFPASRYAEGEHTVEVIATDQVGLETVRRWVVSVKPAPPDAPDESASDVADLPDNEPDAAEDEGAEAPDDDNDLMGDDDGLSQTQIACASDDPYIVTSHFDYSPTELATPPLTTPELGPPTPDAAVAAYLLGTVNLPRITPTAFSQAAADSDTAVYVARVDGFVRGRLDVARDPTGAWTVTWFEACSAFVDSYLREMP